MWKKPKSQNCFKIWISVVECMPINEWNMILSFKKVKHWFLVVKGVNYSTKIDLIELSRSKWSHPIQIKALIIKVWKNIVKPNGTNRKDQKMASESPGLVKIVFKTNKRFFFETCAQSYAYPTNFFEQKNWEVAWFCNGFLGKTSLENELFSILFAFLKSAWWADLKNGLIF